MNNTLESDAQFLLQKKNSLQSPMLIRKQDNSELEFNNIKTNMMPESNNIENMRSSIIQRLDSQRDLYIDFEEDNLTSYKNKCPVTPTNYKQLQNSQNEINFFEALDNPQEDLKIVENYFEQGQKDSIIANSYKQPLNSFYYQQQKQQERQQEMSNFPLDKTINRYLIDDNFISEMEIEQHQLNLNYEKYVTQQNSSLSFLNNNNNNNNNTSFFGTQNNSNSNMNYHQNIEYNNNTYGTYSNNNNNQVQQKNNQKYNQLEGFAPKINQQQNQNLSNIFQKTKKGSFHKKSISKKYQKQQNKSQFQNQNSEKMNSNNNLQYQRRNQPNTQSFCDNFSEDYNNNSSDQMSNCTFNNFQSPLTFTKQNTQAANLFSSNFSNLDLNSSNNNNDSNNKNQSISMKIEEPSIKLQPSTESQQINQVSIQENLFQQQTAKQENPEDDSNIPQSQQQMEDDISTQQPLESSNINIENVKQEQENAQNQEKPMKIEENTTTANHSNNNLQNDKIQEKQKEEDLEGEEEDDDEEEEEPSEKPAGVIGCNCKKSKCLKLYCECFANQGYCIEGCNCNDCRNKIQYEEERQRAIQEALQRNHAAFLPKSQLRKNEENKKGCSCKKTKCLKKYCECYNSGVACTSSCVCVCCENTDLHIQKRQLQQQQELKLQQQQKELLQLEIQKQKEQFQQQYQQHTLPFINNPNNRNQNVPPINQNVNHNVSSNSMNIQQQYNDYSQNNQNINQNYAHQQNNNQNFNSQVKPLGFINNNLDNNFLNNHSNSDTDSPQNMNNEDRYNNQQPFQQQQIYSDQGMQNNQYAAAPIQSDVFPSNY